MDNISFIVFESAQNRLERTIRRLWILIILLIVLLVASNCAWIYYESQFEETTVTEQTVEQDQDGKGDNIFVGGDVNGEAKSKD